MARPGLTGHRKFRRLARLVGSAIVARGALELMWEPCYESGEDYLGTARDIESQVGWMGDCGALALALVECGAPEGHGFIEILSDNGDGTTYKVHDFWHHAPDYVQKRRSRELERKKRVAPSNKRRRTAPNGGQRESSPDRQIEVDRTPAPAPAHTPALAPAPAHSDETIRASANIVALAPKGSLTGKHHLHDPATWSACEAGACVPSFIVSEWRTQIERANGDPDSEIKAFVTSQLASVQGRRIGDPAKFWRGRWHAKHGEQAPAGKGAAVVEGVTRGLQRYVARKAQQGV